MQSLMESLIKLTHANCKLTAEKEELTHANCKLQERCCKQSKQLLDMMKQRQLMMEKFDKQELENSQLLSFLKNLTPVLKNCKDEAEEAALALTAAQNPTQELFENQHVSLLKQLRKMHAQLRSAIDEQTAAETKAVDASAELIDLQKRLKQLQREAEPQSLQIQKFFHIDKNWKTFTEQDWEIWVRNASIQ
jgi:hypothetical protein